MPILYVDNYRGFKDTYIPLKDVNFFVGENSTGKTSILSLIKILSSFEFWFFNSFNTTEITLGTFDEMVNKGQKSFSIGFLGENPKLFPNISEAVYMSFINHDGLPFISEFSYIRNNYNIKIFFKNVLKCKVEKIKENFINKSYSISFFKQWIEHMNTLKRGFKISENELEHEFALARKIKGIEEEIVKKGIIPKLESQMSFFGRDANWIAPIRAKPKRIYESYDLHKSLEGEDSPDKLRKMLASKEAKSKEILSKDIFPFGEKSGLFKGIELKRLGTGDLSPYEINIILDNQAFKICNVGYGVSQILPILVDTFTGFKKQWFLIQQPEIHLHPKAQAAVGDLIYDIHVAEEKNFIIETHSEYLINRFRLRLKENRSNNPRSQVLFFERTDTGNRVQPIEIQNNGKYQENLPATFLDFFIEEDLKLLGI